MRVMLAITGPLATCLVCNGRSFLKAVKQVESVNEDTLAAVFYDIVSKSKQQAYLASISSGFCVIMTRH